MPRSNPPKTTTLLLPPPVSSSSSSSSSPSSSKMSTAPSLDVLLYAQQLAQERGNVFDIESFLTPSQRIQYYATVLHRSPPRAPPPPLPQVTVPSTPVPAKRPIDEEAATPGSVMDENAATLVGTPVSTKRAKLPGLAGLHWKKRQKKMAELARLEAEGIKVDPESLLSPPPETPQAAQNGTTVDGKKRGEVDKDSVQGSASYWNHLLVTARKDRGPQWDYHSQSYHFDRTSPEYYTHGKKPRADKPKVEPMSTAPSSSLGPGIGGSSGPNGAAHVGSHTGSGSTIGTGLRRLPSDTNSHSRSSISQPSSTPSQPARLPSQPAYPGQSPNTQPVQMQSQSQSALQPQPIMPQPSHSQSQQLTPNHPSYRPPPPSHSSSSQTHTSQTPTPGARPTPAQMAGLTPQQLASIGSLNTMGSQQFNPAMIQMARAAAANAQNGGQGLSQAQLAQLASMGMGSSLTPQQLQAFQAQAGGVRPGIMPQGMSIQGMQGVPGLPPGMQGMPGGQGQMGQMQMNQMSQMAQMGQAQMGQMQMGQPGQMQMRPGINPGMMNGQMFQNVRPGMGGMQGSMGGMSMGRPPGQPGQTQAQGQGPMLGTNPNWTEYSR